MNYVVLPIVRLKPLGVGAGLVFKNCVQQMAAQAKGKGSEHMIMLVSEWSCARVSHCGLQQGAVGAWKHNTDHAFGGCLFEKMPLSLRRSRSGLCGDSHEGNMRA